MEALRLQTERATGLRTCRAAVRTQLRKDRTSAMRRYSRGSRSRARALAAAASRAAKADARCLSRFGRTPGRVTVFSAKASSKGAIVLTFRAPGTDGSKAPAARSYLIKESARPMVTAGDFRRAHPLCKGACAFDVIQVRAMLNLRVTGLRPGTTYYYKVAARDNVSNRAGPRSKTVSAKARK